MCRNDAGLVAVSARASSVLTTSYGGAITSAARSGRGRSARKGRTREVIARLYRRSGWGWLAGPARRDVARRDLRQLQRQEELRKRRGPLALCAERASAVKRDYSG